MKAVGLCAPLIAAVLLASCDRPTAFVSDPSTLPPGPGAPTVSHRLSGEVRSLQAGVPIPGVTGDLIGFSTSSFATDATGRFSIDAAGGSLVYTLAAPGFLERRSSLMVTGPRQDVALDMISLEAPFSLEFYRQFARNSRDRPSGYSHTHPWPFDPKFYIHTVTEDTAEPVPEYIVAGVRRVLEASVPELTGGRLKAAEIRSGADSMPGAVGWVQVSFLREVGPGLGGEASVGFQSDRGIIRLRHYATDTLSNPRGCESGAVSVAEHEIVHTMGFFHTDQLATDFQTAVAGCPGVGRSPRALYHAAIMYSRPAGNTDPDHDPPSFSRPASSQERYVVRCGGM